MSAEAEASEGLNKPVDQNAQAADDAKKMLEELSGEVGTNGTSAEKSTEKTNGAAEEQGESEDKRDRSPEYRRRGRDDRGRGGRGRGRGRGGRGGFDRDRPARYNNKSDLTTQEETDDPVAIRKQVRSTTPWVWAQLTFLGRILLLRL